MRVQKELKKKKLDLSGTEIINQIFQINHLAIKPVNLVICFQSLTFPKLLNNLRFYTTAQIYHLFTAFSTRTNLILFSYSVKHRHRMISLSILFTIFWVFIMCPTYKIFSSYFWLLLSPDCKYYMVRGTICHVSLWSLPHNDCLFQFLCVFGVCSSALELWTLDHKLSSILLIVLIGC